MKRFVQGEDRTKDTLLPRRLDDYIAEDNPVRGMEVFVEALDLGTLGFEGVTPSRTGRPAYHPVILLKIYLYGYLNRIQSSRRLERETQRNVELMWLTGRLMPDFKTIANFRKENGEGIRNVCRQFIMLCRRIDLFSEAVIAIDGSKFKAVNHRDRNFTKAKMQRRLAEINASIDRYLAALDTADREERCIAQARKTRLEDRINALKQQMQQLKIIEKQMLQAPDQQLSLTDPDARSMTTRGSGIVGYNVQTAVESQHHLIVAHEVTNVGSDRDHLTGMAKQARAAIGTETLTVVADRGYYKGEQLLACEQAGMIPFVARCLTSGSKAEGRFGKQDFIYQPETDPYRCPAGQQLIRHHTSVENGMDLHVYWASVCPQGPLHSQCTTGKERRIKRWEHEDVLEAMQRRLDLDPEKMRLRRQTVEHPFGTIKAWMGATHFLTRTLPRVRTEMSLHILSYNFKRVLKILGAGPMMQAMRA
jgi:transposase